MGVRTWPPTLKTEHTLRISENRVLRNMSGAKTEKVAGDWRRLHNKELHELS
jgi:hypothetical protein